MDRTTPHSHRGVYSPYTELTEKHTQLQADLRKLVDRWREQRYSDSGFSAYENAMRRCADELEYELNRESNQ